MALKTKIIVGVVAGILWIALCIALAFMPEPKNVNFEYHSSYYYNNLENY